MNIIDSIFYNIISACEIIQRRIWSYGDSVYGERVLRAFLSILAALIFFITIKLSIHVYLSSIIALSPLIYYFFFIRKDTEERYEFALLKFKSLPRWMKNTYFSAISLIFIILPLAIVILILVNIYA
jgi:hypothetical protein